MNLWKSKFVDSNESQFMGFGIEKQSSPAHQTSPFSYNHVGCSLWLSSENQSTLPCGRGPNFFSSSGFR